MLKKCEYVTPPDYLQTLSIKSAKENSAEIRPIAVPLGGGKLAEEYKQMLLNRIAEDTEQIESDILLAKQLATSEELTTSQSLEIHDPILLDDDKINRSIGTSMVPAPILTTHPCRESIEIRVGSNRIQTSASAPAPKLNIKAGSTSTAVNRAKRLATHAADIRSFLTRTTSEKANAPHISDDKPFVEVGANVRGKRKMTQVELLQKHREVAAATTSAKDLDQSGGPVVVELYSECSNTSTDCVFPEPWGCPICTFLNSGLLRVCEMCQHSMLLSRSQGVNMT